MNRGIVVGKVFNLDGTPAKTAKVKVHHVEGTSGNLLIEKFETKTGQDGSYSAPFLWSGIEHGYGELASKNLFIRIVAWTELGDIVRDGNSKDTSHTARTTPGYLARDVVHPANVASGNPFNSGPDLADFAIAIGQALTNYKNLVPFWKISQLLSTEGALIAGGIDLWLDNTN